MSLPLSADQVSPRRRVLLCGGSLFISGLQASLQAVPDLELQLVDAQPENIRESVAAWQPDVVILEASRLKNASTLLLLQEFPRLKLVGLDIEDNRLLVFSGSASYEPTPEDLLQVIEGERRSAGRGMETRSEERSQSDESVPEEQQMKGATKDETDQISRKTRESEQPVISGKEQ